MALDCFRGISPKIPKKHAVFFDQFGVRSRIVRQEGAARFEEALEKSAGGQKTWLLLLFVGRKDLLKPCFGNFYGPVQGAKGIFFEGKLQSIDMTANQGWEYPEVSAQGAKASSQSETRDWVSMVRRRE